MKVPVIRQYARGYLIFHLMILGALIVPVMLECTDFETIALFAYWFLYIICKKLLLLNKSKIYDWSGKENLRKSFLILG